MFNKKVYGVLFFLLLFTVCLAQPPQESDQQISEFSLAGYGEKGKKTWDLAGQSADIFVEVIKLKQVVGNMYGKEEDINLTADKGDFNKVDGKVHLQENVIITTSGGTKLTTDSLDWDRKAQLVTTEDRVNIEKENMVVVGTGARGEPNLKLVRLKKDVQVDINPAAKENEALDPKDKTVITCDGQLEVDYGKNMATFNDNVKVDRPDSIIYSDKMDVYFTPSSKDKVATQESPGQDKAPAVMGNKIDKIVARGNVKVFRGENISYSETATYTAADKKLLLTGKPKLIIYSEEDLKSALTGN